MSSSFQQCRALRVEERDGAQRSHIPCCDKAGSAVGAVCIFQLMVQQLSVVQMWCEVGYRMECIIIFRAGGALLVLFVCGALLVLCVVLLVVRAPSVMKVYDWFSRAYDWFSRACWSLATCCFVVCTLCLY